MRARPYSSIAAGLLAAAVGVAGVAHADGSPRWESGGGWGANSRHGRLWDPARVAAVRGEVEEVFRFTPWRGMSTGIRFALRSDKGALSVHVGPAWFVEHQDFRIEPGDRVTVNGARTTFDGKPALIAREVRKGDRILRLRDEAGRPVWDAWSEAAPAAAAPVPPEAPR